MIAPARVAAYETVRAVNAGRADLPHALARARSRLPDERDRALAGEIATGTLRWQGAFDRIITDWAGRPLARLDPEILDILRLSIFQLLHLERVPASAAVNEAVSLTRHAGKRSAAPLVNAVLRRVSRQRSRLPLPSRPTDPRSRSEALDYLSITLSHPRWLVARWMDRHGFEAAECWTMFNNRPAPLTLRVNRLRTTSDALAAALESHAVTTTPGRFAADALVVTEGNPLLTPLASEGAFLIQDEASQLVPLLTEVRAGERVLDACASPGGKATAMAAAMMDRGLLVATDVRGGRVDLLARTIRGSGATCIRIVRTDAARALPFRALFDCVLLDAPCSGLGTIRRDPDVKWRRAEKDLAALAAVQLAMLDQASQVLRPGGRLVYSTCSSEPEENEQVIEQFLTGHPSFRLTVPGGLPATVRSMIETTGYFRTHPFRDGLEAFFAAILVKTEASQ
jgi:16S rRNA (cytosine967-C5)-methyltransferase